jgi:hypothetical protein
VKISGLRGVDTGDTFNECALTGTVVSDKGSYFACCDVEVNILKDVYRSKRFVDASK